MAPYYIQQYSPYIVTCESVRSVSNTTKTFLRRYPLCSVSGSNSCTTSQLNHFHFSGDIYMWQLKGARIGLLGLQCVDPSLAETSVLTHGSRAGLGTLNLWRLLGETGVATTQGMLWRTSSPVPELHSSSTRTKGEAWNHGSQPEQWRWRCQSRWLSGEQRSSSSLNHWTHS